MAECYKKVYDSRADAEKELHRIKSLKKAMNDRRRREVRPYQCRFCGKYHLTSKKYYETGVFVKRRTDGDDIEEDCYDTDDSLHVQISNDRGQE